MTDCYKKFSGSASPETDFPLFRELRLSFDRPNSPLVDRLAIRTHNWIGPNR